MSNKPLARRPASAPPPRRSLPAHTVPPPRTLILPFEKTWTPAPEAPSPPANDPPAPSRFNWLDILLIVLTGGLVLALVTFMGPGKPMGSNRHD